MRDDFVPGDGQKIRFKGFRIFDIVPADPNPCKDFLNDVGYFIFRFEEAPAKGPQPEMVMAVESVDGISFPFQKPENQKLYVHMMNHPVFTYPGEMFCLLLTIPGVLQSYGFFTGF
jgi:hypothetical protein